MEERRGPEYIPAARVAARQSEKVARWARQIGVLVTLVAVGFGGFWLVQRMLDEGTMPAEWTAELDRSPYIESEVKLYGPRGSVFELKEVQGGISRTIQLPGMVIHAGNALNDLTDLTTLNRYRFQSGARFTFSPMNAAMRMWRGARQAGNGFERNQDAFERREGQMLIRIRRDLAQNRKGLVVQWLRASDQQIVRQIRSFPAASLPNEAVDRKSRDDMWARVAGSSPPAFLMSHLGDIWIYGMNPRGTYELTTPDGLRYRSLGLADAGYLVFIPVLRGQPSLPRDFTLRVISRPLPDEPRERKFRIERTSFAIMPPEYIAANRTGDFYTLMYLARQAEARAFLMLGRGTAQSPTNTIPTLWPIGTEEAERARALYRYLNPDEPRLLYATWLAYIGYRAMGMRDQQREMLAELRPRSSLFQSMDPEIGAALQIELNAPPPPNR